MASGLCGLLQNFSPSTPFPSCTSSLLPSASQLPPPPRPGGCKPRPICLHHHPRPLRRCLWILTIFEEWLLEANSDSSCWCGWLLIMELKALLLSGVKVGNDEQNVQRGAEESGKWKKKLFFLLINSINWGRISWSSSASLWGIPLALLSL